MSQPTTSSEWLLQIGDRNETQSGWVTYGVERELNQKHNTGLSKTPNTQHATQQENTTFLFSAFPPLRIGSGNEARVSATSADIPFCTKLFRDIDSKQFPFFFFLSPLSEKRHGGLVVCAVWRNRKGRAENFFLRIIKDTMQHTISSRVFLNIRDPRLLSDGPL